MKKYAMRSRLAFIGGTAFLTAVLLLLFSCAAKPVFMHWTMRSMDRGFRAIRSMDPGEGGFDEDEIDILDDLNRFLNVIIIDSGNNTIYGNYNLETSSSVLNMTQDRKEEFVTEPKAQINSSGKGSERMMITLKGLIEEDDTVYYVYLYKRIRSLMSMIEFARKVLAVMLIVFFLLEVLLFLLLSSDLFRSIGNISETLRRVLVWTSHPAETQDRVWDQEWQLYLPSDPGITGSGKAYPYFADMIRPLVSRLFTQEARLYNFEYMMKYDTEEADEKDQMPKELLRNITHQLKTPLAIISNQLELDHDEIDPEKKAYYYQSVMDEIDKMSMLISDILRNPSGKQSYVQVRLCRICISDLLGELAQKYAGWLETDRRMLDIRIEPDLYVMADAMQVRQAVNNYMMNAYSHTKPGKKIRLSLEKEQDNCVISVYNEGDGIPEEELDSIWKDHVRGSSGENEGYRGTCIGLYIVNMIVEKHHGKCGCHNEKSGVTFWLSLPVK